LIERPVVVQAITELLPGHCAHTPTFATPLTMRMVRGSGPPSTPRGLMRPYGCEVNFGRQHGGSAAKGRPRSTSAADRRAWGTSVTAAVDGGRSARCCQGFVAERLGDDLLVAGLLIGGDVAVGHGEVHRPRGPLGLVAGIDRPDAIFGQEVVGGLDRVLGLFGGLHHDRLEYGFVQIVRAV